MKNKIFTLCCLYVLGVSQLWGTQEFTLQDIKAYITEKNFYIFKALTQNRISQENLNMTKGAFDTKLQLKYEEKSYPLSESNYYDTALIKPTESGIDFSIGYRKADGTQEYNNIKTDPNGEMIIGAKIPLVSVLNKIDERRLKVNLAQNGVTQTDLRYKESLRKFHFTLMTSYYALLYYKEIEKLREDIFDSMKQREAFIASKVSKGKLPRMDLLEAKRELLQAKQQLLDATKEYKNQLFNFIKLLNVSEEVFLAKYHLGSLPVIGQQVWSFNQALNEALKNRPDLQLLYAEKEKLFIENRGNEVKKYPKFELNLQGVYDENEQSGLKVSLQMNFPIARTSYRAKREEIKYKITIIENEKELQLIELQTDLKRVFNSLSLINKNIVNTENELSLLKELQELEKKKYELGSSTLFLLNQREMQKAQGEVRLLYYKYQYHLWDQILRRVMNKQLLF